MSKPGEQGQDSEGKGGADGESAGTVPKVGSAGTARRSGTTKGDGCKYDSALEASVNERLSHLETSIRDTLSGTEKTLKVDLGAVAGTLGSLKSAVDSLADEFRKDASVREDRLEGELASWGEKISGTAEIIGNIQAHEERISALETANEKDTGSPDAAGADSQIQGSATPKAPRVISPINKAQDAVSRARDAKPAERTQLFSEAIRIVEPLAKNCLADSEKVQARMIAQQLRYLNRMYPKDYAEASALASRTNS